MIFIGDNMYIYLLNIFSDNNWDRGLFRYFIFVVLFSFSSFVYGSQNRGIEEKYGFVFREKAEKDGETGTSRF